jgi:hypothetical protein
MIILVSYDLKGLPGSHKPLFDALQKVGDSWWHYLSNTWLISTYKNTNQVYAELQPYLASNDLIVIVPIIGREKWGVLPKDAWGWIDKHQDEPSQMQIPTVAGFMRKEVP